MSLRCANIKTMQKIDPNNPITSYKGLDFELDGNKNEGSFIVMGCWNSYCMNVVKGTFIQSSFQRLVVKMIEQCQGDIRAQYIIGAGDNHYNHPLGIAKSIRTILDIGEKCFDKINIPMYMSIGNHDVRTPEIMAEQLKKTYDGLKITSPNIKFPSNWILPSAYYHLNHKLDNSNIDFFYIETSLLSGHHFLGDLEKSKLADEMLEWLDYTLAQCTGVKCIVGHHPIFAVGHIDPNLPIINKNLINLYKIAIKHKIHFYLCADEHNSQYIYDDTNDIHHVVAGGAPGSGGDIAVIHDYPGDYHRPDVKIACINEENISYQVRSIFTFSGPSFIHFNINSDSIEFRIKGITDNIVHNNQNDINDMCNAGYVGKIDVLKDEADIYIKDFFVKKIPRYHNLMFMVDCASYTHIKKVSNLRNTKAKLILTNSDIASVTSKLDMLDKEIAEYNAKYRNLIVLLSHNQ